MGVNSQVHAQNPIIQTKYTVDPAPLVYNDTIFLYTSHDEDNAFGFKVQGVDFSKGISSVQVCVAALYGGKIEIHADKIDGLVLGLVDITASAEGDIYKTATAPVKNIKGVHDLYFLIKGEKDLFNFDWWKFNGKY